MKKSSLKCLWLALVMGLAASPPLVEAQFFNIPGNGDLAVGFRKTGAHQGTNELVVFIDNVTNLLALSPGTTVTNGNVSAAQLTDAFSADYTFLQWSVFGANLSASASWSTPLGAFPQSTIWYTLPRTNSSTQSQSKNRFSSTAQANVATSMFSIGNGANTLSSQLPGGTNADNNTILVREPVQGAYQQFLLTTFMGDSGTPSLGDFGGTVFNFSVEQITPGPFSSSVRADLYESAPAPSSRPATNYLDPISGSTTNVYYVGYFDLSPAGVLTFTRASTAVVLPPAPTLSITHSGNTSTISFTATNSATYNLIFTNLSGLTSPRSNWFSLGSPITGVTGGTNFMDTTTDPGRVYSVTAH